MSLRELFEAFERTAIGEAIRHSVWLFPVVETVHLMALALLGGAVLMLDLRLLGVGLESQSPSALERQTRPWLLGAITVMLVTGAMLAASEAIKLYEKDAYWLKMGALAAVLAFTFAVKHPMARRDPAIGAATRTAAFVSIALWLTVAGAGRWIGFS